MEFTTQYNPDLGLVQCTLVGPVPADEIVNIQVEAIRLAREKGTRLFLIDNSRWEASLSLLDIYKWPRLYKEMKVNRSYRLAMILSDDPTAQKAIKFYETVCRNRGWEVAVFKQRREALDWLHTNSGTKA
ncbi:MAG: hypothetical protein P8010_12375 [Desulfosarcinaceae bacterium]